MPNIVPVLRSLPCENPAALAGNTISTLSPGLCLQCPPVIINPSRQAWHLEVSLLCRHHGYSSPRRPGRAIHRGRTIQHLVYSKLVTDPLPSGFAQGGALDRVGP